MKPIWVVLKKNWINLKYANVVIGSMLTLEGKIKLGLAWYLQIILIPSKADVSPTPITVGFPEQVDCFSLCRGPLGFPVGSVVKDLPAIAGDDPSGFYLWVRKIPWRRKWQPTPVFLPGKSHGQRSLAGYSPWGHKESDTTKRLSNRGSLAVRQGPVFSSQVSLTQVLLLTSVVPGAWNSSLKSFSPTSCQLPISISTAVWRLRPLPLLS